MKKKIGPVKRLSGEITLPGDKSISHRAIMLGAIAQGKTQAKNILDCDDCNYTMKAFKAMGVTITQKGDLTTIIGKGLDGLKRPRGPLNVGNSGTTMRLLAGVLAGQKFDSILEGDTSLSNRPMTRIVEPLSAMGVNIKPATGGLPPLNIIGGKVNPISYRMPIPSAQVKSAILLAGLYADGLTTVEEVFKSRDHTERMLKYFGAKIKIKGLKISLEGQSELEGKVLEIPGDVSSASFLIAGAAMLQDSKIRINKVSINPTRAGILEMMSRMGARIKILNKVETFEPVGDIEVEWGNTRGIVIDESEIPSVIDELPIIFVLAALSRGNTIIKGAGELRVKETDRIRSMKTNLENMGGRVHVRKDEIVIEGVEGLHGAQIKSFGDHRTCMAMAIAALAAKGESVIDDDSCVNKSFPEFFDVLGQLSK